MKRFRFALASVARVRALEERVAREQYLMAQGSLGRAEQRHRLAREVLEAQEALDGALTMGEVRWSFDQAARGAAAVHEAAGARDAARAAAALELERWRTAARRASALERLEASARAAWLDQLRDEEARDLDDLATLRFSARDRT